MPGACPLGLDIFRLHSLETELDRRVLDMDEMTRFSVHQVGHPVVIMDKCDKKELITREETIVKFESEAQVGGQWQYENKNLFLL